MRPKRKSGQAGSGVVAPQWRRFTDNMSHLPMKLLRKKIEKRNLKLRQRNLKLQGEMRGAWGLGASVAAGARPRVAAPLCSGVTTSLKSRGRFSRGTCAC